MNKKRLLELIEIMKSKSDMEHKLSLAQIIELLEERGIEVNNRKTLYDDFKVLSEYGFEIEYDGAYYLSESPFSLSEIKIIIDSLNSLKNLDDSFLKRISEKMYSFISEYEVKQLKKLDYHNKHSDRKFINRLEDVLDAIKNNKMLRIKRNNKNEELIAPVFLHRQNDYYYLYYHYPEKDKLYHVRFDNILDTNISDIDNDIIISHSKLIDHINESSNSFSTGKSSTIKIKIINDSEYLRSRLIDDFPNIVFTKDGFSLKASISDAFFSKLTAYKDDIKISDKSIADQYIDYLKRIIICNQ